MYVVSFKQVFILVKVQSHLPDLLDANMAGTWEHTTYFLVSKLWDVREVLMTCPDWSLAKEGNVKFKKMTLSLKNNYIFASTVNIFAI